MKDRIVQNPHRYQLIPVSGETNTYDIIAKPGVVTEVGTPINKANLLSDETAALFGLGGSNATPNEAFKVTAGKFLVDNGKSLTDNGYAKIGNLIIQWGTGVLDGDPAIITFPIAFPNGCFSVANSASRADGYAANSNIVGITKTGFSLYGYSCKYVAIGH